MKGRVVPELRRWKPATPTVRHVMDRATEVHLHALVDALTLAIGLGMVRRGVQQFGARRGEELSPERAGEDAVAVGDNRVGEAVELDDIVPKDAGHLRRVGRMMKRDEVREFRQPVNDHHDRVVSFRLWQPLDEVHGEVLPWRRGNGERGQQSSRSAMLMFSLLTD